MTALAPTVDDHLMWDTVLSLYRLPVVTVADEIGTFAALSDEALSTQELASRIGADVRALGIHLAVLAAMGFVTRPGGLWRATAATRTWLHPRAEGYHGPAIHGFRQSQPLHAQLLETLRTGERGAGHITAAEEWERGEMPAELARNITGYMNAHSSASSRAVAMLPAFAVVNSLLDVGGGSAVFSIQIARAWPALRATVMDIEVVCREAERYISAAAMAGRVSTHAANMFTEAWPSGHDAHLLSNILHDWSDETCRLLLRKSYEALPAGGTIMLHEMLMDEDGCGPLPAACMSLLMLLGTKGRQFSFSELAAFLDEAGFREPCAALTPQGCYSLVTAQKP